MYKKRRLLSQNTLNLDSLMDVLSNTVGVMLFIVIFAVIQSQGVSFRMLAPYLRNPPKEAKRQLFICKEGRIRPLNMSQALDSWLENHHLTYNNMPSLVRKWQKQPYNDGYFHFTVDYEQWEDHSYWWTTVTSRALKLIVKEDSVSSGETARDLSSPDSDIHCLFRSFDPERNWIAFAVCDEESLDVFRKARNLAATYRISNGWDPVRFNFPDEIILSGGSSGVDMLTQIGQ